VFGDEILDRHSNVRVLRWRNRLRLSRLATWSLAAASVLPTALSMFVALAAARAGA
jgi:hypothetical protein